MGETQIITKILETLPQRNRWCVEFGAWDGLYLSNTRDLIENHAYSAVLIEAHQCKFEELCSNYSELDTVLPMNALVGFDENNNLDMILKESVVPCDFDFLSIDIDGNDYHVWQAMERLQPKVVCIEFNPTIPNQVDFVQAADVNLNHGCSLKSLVELGKRKDYELVDVSTTNAFFVRREYFDLFDIENNSLDCLRKTDLVTHLFSGYDGTIFLRGNRSLPWHGLTLDENSLQQLPEYLRKFPSSRTTYDVWLFRLYRLIKSPVRFIKHWRGSINDRKNDA